jgi:general stress protein 26
MEGQDLRRSCVKLVESAWPAYLGTVDLQGRPRIRAIFNLRNRERFPNLVPLFQGHDDDLLLFFTTNTSSAKVAELKANPAVAVYFSNPEESFGLMLGGDMDMVTDTELRRALWHDGWEKYYPGGYDDPDHTVLRLRPQVARGWNPSETFEFSVG